MTTYTGDALENHTVAGPSAVFTYRRTGPRGGVPLVLLGVHDGMIPALASYKAVEQVPNSTLVLYSDAGHAFLFQHIDEFVAQVDLFLAN